MRPARAAPVVGLLLALVAGAGFVAATRDRVGVGWDEAVNARYGETVVDYFASGGRDRAFEDVANLRHYGALVEAVAALAYRDAPERKWPRRHLVVGLLALSAAWFLYRVARATRSPRTTLLAPITLVTLPPFVGHALVNSKDAPFAAAITAVAAAAVAVFAERGRRWPRYAALALAVGAALAVRPAGIVVVLMIVLGAAALGDFAFRGARPIPARTGLRLLGALSAGWALMIAAWPFAHAAPLWNPLVGIANAVAFQPAYDVRFAGEVFSSDALPRRYLPQMLALKIPVAHLVLAALGASLALRSLRRALRGRERRRAVVLGVALVWLLVPVAGQVALGANVYDGCRHFLFVLPAIALLAAHGAGAIADAFSRRGWARAGTGLAVALLVAPVPAMVRLHPYEYTYYNALAGGMSGADGRYETDYWALSYREALEWIATRTEARSLRPGPALGGGPTRVLAGGTAFLRPAVEAFAPPGSEVEMVTDPAAAEWPDGADWYVGVARFGFATRTFPDAPIVHRVEREGVTLAVVRGRPGGPR